MHTVTVGASEKISTREIDNIIGKYSEDELANVRVETFTDKDTVFILAHLPVETLCYNATIAKTHGHALAWSMLKSGVGEGLPYRAINFAYDPRRTGSLGQFTGWMCGDKYSGNIGIIDRTIARVFASENEWILYTPFMKFETFSIDEIEIETIPGRSNVTGLIDDVPDGATVAVSVTTDGSTYSMEEWELYGEPSNYGTRFILRQGGYVQDWIGFRLRGTSQSRMAFALFKVKYG